MSATTTTAAPSFMDSFKAPTAAQKLQLIYAIIVIGVAVAAWGYYKRTTKFMYVGGAVAAAGIAAFVYTKRVQVTPTPTPTASA